MSSLSLSGLLLGSFKLQDCIGSGAFAHVYKAVDVDSGTVHAIKVARDEIARPVAPLPHGLHDSGREFLSEAIGIYTGGYGSVTPDAARLMAIGAERTASADCHLLVAMSAPQVAGESGVIYTAMDLIEGRSLRAVLRESLVGKTHKLDTDVFCSVAEQLCDFLSALQAGPMKYHGDLKPENVLVQKDCLIRVIDPGYVGQVNCREGYLPSVAVTTPLYNPTLAANDVFGFGSILWELATGYHPLRTSRSASSEQEHLALSDELETTLALQEMSGRYFLSPLRHLILPSRLAPSLTKEVESILLNALGYAINDAGELTCVEQPLNFDDLKLRIRGLRAA